MVAFFSRSKSHEADGWSQGNNRWHGLNPLTARFLDWLHPQTYVLVTTVHFGGASLHPSFLRHPRPEISEFPSETLSPPFVARAPWGFKLLNGFLTRKWSVLLSSWSLSLNMWSKVPHMIIYHISFEQIQNKRKFYTQNKIIKFYKEIWDRLFMMSI